LLSNVQYSLVTSTLLRTRQVLVPRVLHTDRFVFGKYHNKKLPDRDRIAEIDLCPLRSGQKARRNSVGRTYACLHAPTCAYLQPPLRSVSLKFVCYWYPIDFVTQPSDEIVWPDRNCGLTTIRAFGAGLKFRPGENNRSLQHPEPDLGILRPKARL